MTASKASRARNGRSGTQGNAARSTNASSARNTNSAANAVRAGTGVKNGNAASTASPARNGIPANGGGSGKNGGGARNGVTARSGGAGRGGTAARTGPAARTSGAARRAGPAGRGGAGGRALQDDFSARTASPGPALWLQLTTFVLALAGLGVSIYLTIAHFTESALLGCSESGLVNCTKVTTSAQSYVFGIPVAVLGLAFYAFAVAIMSPWAWRASRREIHLLRIASLVVGIGFVLYLLYAELFIIGSICLYCTSVHIITFLIFVLTMGAVAAWGLRPGAPWTLRLGRFARETEAQATA